MSTERKTRPRWQVRLWSLILDAVTGGMALLGALFTIALVWAWVWAAVEGPTPVQWVSRALGGFAALVLLGRLVDRWDRRSPPEPSMVPTVVRTLDLAAPGHCTSYRALPGSLCLVRCELSTHQAREEAHQVSRPNGRWIWGAGVSTPTWRVDDHFAITDPHPPVEPFDWAEYNQTQIADRTRRSDEPRP